MGRAGPRPYDEGRMTPGVISNPANREITPGVFSGGSMTKVLPGCVLALMLAAIAPLVAHHSPAAFDRTREVTLKGTVKEFRWQNPHTWIEVNVPDDKGKVVLWGVELTSPTYLIRAGWKSNIIKPGDHVTVIVNPVRTGEPAGIFRKLILADGRELTERPARLGTPNAK